MYTNLGLQCLARQVWYCAFLNGQEQLQSHVGDLACMVRYTLREAARHHIGVTNSLHLVNLVPLDGSVKRAERLQKWPSR